MAASTSTSKAAPARRSGRPTSAQAAQLELDMKEAALHLFLTRGYDGTSMDDIAAAARTTKQSLYARFRSKDELFTAVLNWAIERPDWPATEPEADIDPDDLESALTAIAESAVKRVLDPQMVGLVRLAISQADRFPEVARKTYSMWPRQRVVASLLRRHAAAGSIHVADPDIMAEHFLAMVAVAPARLASFGIVRDGRAQRRRTESAVQLFLRGLRPE